MSQIERLIIGCHHKTGTKLFGEFLKVKVIGSRLELLGNILFAKHEDRKLPFSMVLQRLPKSCCYIDAWFEHEMDVAPSSLHFLHFVRHPADRIRSAYLYHRMGGPGERERWLDWRIFKIGYKMVSYHELLNTVDDKTGILIEAIRCYPEIAGTARAAQTSAHLTQRLQISLEQIEADFNSSIKAVCEFMGLDETNARVAVEALRDQDLSRKEEKDLPNHVTRYKPEAENLRRYLLEDPSFSRLYFQCAEQTGFECPAGQFRAESLIDDDLLTNILDNKVRLLTDFRTDQAQTDLRCNMDLRHWLPYALQRFGEGGHLMMHEFVQAFIDGVNGRNK